MKNSLNPIVGAVLIMLCGCSGLCDSGKKQEGDSPGRFRDGTARTGKKLITGWKEDFKPGSKNGEDSIPKGWDLKTKPGTAAAVFSIMKKKKNDGYYLHMEADKASASLVYKLGKVDLEKTPVLRWRWRETVLPNGADGRVESKDDQVIGIYIGTGTMLKKRSISYRWDTDTPAGTEGNCVYGLGTINIKWFTLKNKADSQKGMWYIEKRNCAEDFKKAWGFYPKNIYISISCNSQYTGTKAAGDIDWIEFLPANLNP